MSAGQVNLILSYVLWNAFPQIYLWAIMVCVLIPHLALQNVKTSRIIRIDFVIIPKIFYPREEWDELDPSAHGNKNIQAEKTDYQNTTKVEILTPETIIQKNVLEENLMKLNCCTAADVSITENWSSDVCHQTSKLCLQIRIYPIKEREPQNDVFLKASVLGKLAECLTELNYVMTCEKILLGEPPRLLNTACSQVLHELWRADFYMDQKSSVFIRQRL